MSRARLRFAWGAAAALLLASSPALAVDPPDPEPDLGRGSGRRLEWDPAWSRFGVGHYTALGAGAVVTGVALAIGPDGENPRRGGVLIDDDVRRGLRLGTPLDRQDARDASDILLAFNTSYPFLVDSLIVASWYRDSPDVGGQIALVTAEVYSVTLALQTVVNVVSSRERPFVKNCGLLIDPETHDCVATNRFRSYFSGHTALSFAAASVTCVHHAKMPLFGGGAADAVPCVAGLGLAGTTGALRIMADQHYFTDVATGAVVGTLTGVSIPLLFHYHGRTEPPAGDRSASEVSVQVVPSPTGIHAVGTF